MVIPGIQPYNNSLFNIIQPSVHPLSNPDYNSINGELYNLTSFPFLEMFLLFMFLDSSIQMLSLKAIK